ncbi:MAG: metal ABC transporter permease [Calditrichaeota bacterium]|nr:metal ABC transporter permease [Calditrichota bacterium]MCB9367583.1 metal ABC transporter permease [Calditrichota bacterium]
MNIEFWPMLVAAVLLGISCGAQSFMVVHRRMAFMGHGASHGMIAGVGLALFLHWPVFPVALLTALIFSIAVGLLPKRDDISSDSAIGILLAAAVAFGLLLSGVHDQMHSHDDCGGGHLEEFLVGSLDQVFLGDVYFLAALALVVVLALVFYWEELLLFLFDPEGARIAGLPVKLLHLGSLSVLAVTIALAMKIAGVLLVGALLVIPGATAGLMSQRASTVVTMSVLMGAFTSLVGAVIAVNYGLSPGPIIVLLLFALFLVARVFAKSQ